MNKHIITGIKGLLLLFVLVIVGGYAYYALTYIDETITENSAYGFYIGESKEESYKRAKENLSEKNTSILYPISKHGYGPYKKYEFTPGEYELIKDRDIWSFYFDDGGYSDVVELKFESNRLVSIHRHRQHFELP